MADLFVTRHSGAVDWARQNGIEAELVPHLDVKRVQAGDRVLGTLPVQMIAQVNERGAGYLHLEMTIPAEARGRDLSAEDMERFGAKLVEYRAEKVE